MMKALDTYARLGILQLENAIIDEIRFNNDFDFSKDNDLIEKYLGEIKRIIVKNHPDENISKLGQLSLGNCWSLGLSGKHIPKRSQLAYEMYKTLAHKKWKDNPDKRSYTVDSDEGLKLTDESRIKVISEDERSLKIKNILNDDV
jgi:hypothetical protein